MTLHDTVTWPHPYENELRTIDRLFPAYFAFRALLADCMKHSDMMEEQLQYVLDALSDNMPDEAEWREQIAARMIEERAK